MLIQFGQDLGDYMYDVFVAKFDFWLAFGLVAQLLFTARFLVQWISSERAGRSVVASTQHQRDLTSASTTSPRRMIVS